MTRVAIIDDDESHCRAFARLLRASGMEAACFRSAEAYLETVSVQPFDCLVLDIQLGGMSGFDLWDRLSTSASAPAVVFLTAMEEPETVERMARTGRPCVRKTDPGTRVLDEIRRAVADAPPSRTSNVQARLGTAG